MSQENVDALLKATETFNGFAADPARDVTDFLQFVDPGVRFEPQQALLQGSYSGLDGVTEWLVDLAEHYESGRMDFTDIRDLGDRVLALGTGRVTGRGSGLEIDVPLAILASFREGLITHLKDYGDKRQALEAAGLSE